MKLALIGTVIMGTILGIVFSGINLLYKKHCLSAYENYNPQYSFMTDCRVEVEGVLTPVSVVRINK